MYATGRTASVRLPAARCAAVEAVHLLVAALDVAVGGGVAC